MATPQTKKSSTPAAAKPKASKPAAAKRTVAKPAAAKRTAAKPAARKPAAPAKPPTSREIAALLGTEIKPPLKPDQIARLRKALPGYVGILDDVAALLEADQDMLNMSDITPDMLLQAQAEQKYLGAREAVAYSVYRSLFEQRLQVDDRAMKILEKLARRVNVVREDDPDLPDRWKLLLDFLGTFRQGGGSKKAAAAPEAAPAPAEPVE